MSRTGLYFKEQVRRELVERFGWERVYQGGLRVYTTIDIPTCSAAAEPIVERMLARDRAASRLAHARRGAKPAARRRSRARLSAGRARRARSGDGRGARAGRRARLRREPVQSRRAGASGSRGRRSSRSSIAAALEQGFTPATLIEQSRRPDPDARRATGCPKTSTPTRGA